MNGDLQKALDKLRQSIESYPGFWDAYFWKGVIHAQLGGNDEAMKNIKQSLDRGMPPVLLSPLRWLTPQFYKDHAISLFAEYGLTDANEN